MWKADWPDQVKLLKKYSYGHFNLFYFFFLLKILLHGEVEMCTPHFMCETEMLRSIWKLLRGPTVTKRLQEVAFV